MVEHGWKVAARLLGTRGCILWKLIRNVKHGRRVMQNAGRRILRDIGEIISQEYIPNGTPFDTKGAHNLLIFY